jgi:hypothetical protein
MLRVLSSAAVRAVLVLALVSAFCFAVWKLNLAALWWFCVPPQCAPARMRYHVDCVIRCIFEECILRTQQVCLQCFTSTFVWRGFGTLDSSATLIGDYRIQVILSVFYCNCTAALDDGGIVVGTIIKPKFGLQPKSFGESCYAF